MAAAHPCAVSSTTIKCSHPLLKQDVEREEYVNFFRAMTKSFDEPLGWAHFKAEGDVEFK